MKRFKHRRKAISYILVLGTIMVVTVIGLSAITTMRIRWRSSKNSADFIQTRLFAQSAIDLGMLYIENNPNWRQQKPNGLWVDRVPIGNGFYSLIAIDPNDGILNNAEMDAVIMTGIGLKDQARYKLQITLQPILVPISSLASSLHAGNDLVFNDVTVTSDHIISANDTVRETNSTIDADVEAVNAINGTGYTKLKTIGIVPREMPDTATVFEFYKTNGTWIPLSMIPTLSGVKTIANNVIGPKHNPYGGTNLLGIYVIDCGGQPFQIHNSRIVGTLVLLNAGNGSAVYDSVNWEPAVPNYPALLVEGGMNFVYLDTPLAEADVFTSLNPPDVPYNDVEDTDTTDIYPSVIKGLIYVSSNVGTDTGTIPVNYRQNIHVTIRGALIVGNVFSFVNPVSQKTSTLDLTYDRIYHDNPPPGFMNPPRMIIAEGSWRQVVD